MARGGKPGLVKWFIPPEILRVIGHVLVGVLAGVLCVFTFLHFLSTFKEKKPLNLSAPRLMPSHQPGAIPTNTPVPAPTPRTFKFFFPTYTPTPDAEVEVELTPEEKFWEAWRWDHERRKHTIETGVETGKKKKKKTPVPDHVDENGILQDSNGDGILEFSIPVLYSAGEKAEQATWYTSFVHICCGCALTHRVYVNFYFGPVGFRVWQRWEVLDQETHINRVRKFGPNYWRNPSGFFDHDHFMSDPIGGYSIDRP